MTRRSIALVLVAMMLSPLAAAQPYAPIVTMVVTMPDGRIQELTAVQSDQQRAHDSAWRNRTPKRRSGDGFENESFLQGVRSQGVRSNVAD